MLYMYRRKALTQYLCLHVALTQSIAVGPVKGRFPGVLKSCPVWH